MYVNTNKRFLGKLYLEREEQCSNEAAKHAPGEKVEGNAVVTEDEVYTACYARSPRLTDDTAHRQRAD